MAEPDKQQFGDGSDQWANAAQNLTNAAKELGKECPLPELMDRKKRDIMERKGDKEDENKRQKQQKESSAAAL